MKAQKSKIPVSPAGRKNQNNNSKFKNNRNILQPTTYNPQLTIGWLYPELMSTYGDRGNIICLTKRGRWRGIKMSVLRIGFETKRKDLENCDLILGGGAQDRQQEIAIADLKINKASLLKRLFRRGTPGLFVCGSPQLLGKYYMTGDGIKLEGLGIFDFVTRHFGNDKPRCIGNTVGKVQNIDLAKYYYSPITNYQLPITTIVGFENHGGRTYLGKNTEPFAKVLKGFGNNGEDGSEGAIYKNVIACYYHGPFLPKNPHIADWLISKALEVKYGEEVELKPLDDTLEWEAHDFMLRKLGIR